MCCCSSFHCLLYVPVDCFVRVASAVFYFGCKVKHLLSCTVHREHSAGYYCTCVLCKCMPDGHCRCCCCMWCLRERSSTGKREKKKEEALWFPPWVLLHFLTVADMLPRETLAVTNAKGWVFFLPCVVSGLAAMVTTWGKTNFPYLMKSHQHQIHLLHDFFFLLGTEKSYLWCET